MFRKRMPGKHFENLACQADDLSVQPLADASPEKVDALVSTQPIPILRLE